MIKFKIYHSARFDGELAKYDLNFQDKVDKIEDQLIDNPYVGNPLNVKWFREKRIQGKRVYFIIYKDLESVFMVAISDKKDQQKIINTVRFLFDFLRDEIRKLIDGDGLT